jgi:D-threonate/D-erythronate kinase
VSSARLRLLADDLTGALDSAARFVGSHGTIPVVWLTVPDFPCLAIDAATRDADAETARNTLLCLAPALAGADLAFKKIDSLLRGHVALEIRSCMQAAGFEHAVVAPAFPFQGRIFSDGRQLAHGQDVGIDLRTDLSATLCRPGDAAPSGISLWDAATDTDLDAIVAAGRRLPGRVLWCGTAGLAGSVAGHVKPPCPMLPRPIVALIGSDHATARVQLDACPRRLTIVDPEVIGMVADGVAIDVGIPPGLPRTHVRHMIATAFAALLRRIDRPGTCIVAGGETLRGLADALGAARLEVDGELEPGVPTSRMIGGALDGMRIVSKSGAFGGVGFLARLLAG